MPKKDGRGPKGNGPRTGKGGGNGQGPVKTGAGPKTGGKKGKC